MGVPGLFPFYQSRFSTAVNRLYKTGNGKNSISVKGKNITIDNLYLDGNAILHGVTQYVFKYQKFADREMEEWDNSSLKEKMLVSYKRFYDAMISIYNRFENVKLLYISMDGVCPLAKQAQQRQRRYGGTLDSKELDDTTFTSFMISPGTMYMYELNYYLREYIKDTCKNIPDLKIILDDSSVPGEGEHKILDYIRENHNKDTHCIYSPDGDLLILCSSIHLPGMYLMMDDKLNFKELENYIINVTDTTEQLAMIVSSIDRGTESDIYTAVDDFTLLSFLIGNDFFPKIRCLDILRLSLSDIVSRYSKCGYRLTYRERRADTKYREADKDRFKNRYKSKIDINSLYRFLKEYAATEESQLIKIGKKTDSEDGTDLSDHRLKYYIKDTVKGSVLDMAGYKRFYYFKAFNPSRYSEYERPETTSASIRSEMDSLDTDIRTSKPLQDMCKNYIEMMSVIFYYYTDTLASWTEMYRYHYAPLLCDLVSYLEISVVKNIIPNPRISFELESPTDPFLNLISILSPKHRILLPEYFSILMTKKSPLVKSKMLPDTFSIDYQGVEKKHKAVHLVPFIDRELLYIVYNTAIESAGRDNIERTYPRNSFGSVENFYFKR